MLHLKPQINISAKQWFGNSVDIEIYHPDNFPTVDLIIIKNKVEGAVKGEVFSMQELIDFGAAVKISEGKTLREVFSEWKYSK